MFAREYVQEKYRTTGKGKFTLRGLSADSVKLEISTKMPEQKAHRP